MNSEIYSIFEALFLPSQVIEADCSDGQPVAKTQRVALKVLYVMELTPDDVRNFYEEV